VFEGRTGQPLVLLGAAGGDAEAAMLRFALDQGDPEAVIQLCWNLYHAALFRRILGRGIPADQAEDVLQCVFALLHREYEAVRGPKLRGWLWTIADYECLRHIQQSVRARRNLDGVRRLAGADGGRDTAPSPESLVDARRGVEAVLAFFAGLTPYEEELFQTSWIECASVEETLVAVSRKYGKQIDRRQLARQRHRLRQRLAESIAHWRSGGRSGECP
jgi:RNA polymerase sigma factor (sigma-70 family)